MAGGGVCVCFFFFFFNIGDFSEDHILFLTEISLEDRVVFFYHRGQKVNFT